MVADMVAGCVIGVDLGGTKLLAGTVDADLHVHHRAHRPAQAPDLAGVVDRLVDAITEARESVASEVLAVGVGIPSLMDLGRGIALSTNHLPIAGVAIGDLLAERLGLPVFVDNDATAALIAEHRAGAAVGVDDALMLTLGTGIGGGILAGGRIIRGAVGAAGELGHMVVDLDGPPCFGSCPNRGCLEALASGSALAREARRRAAEAPGTPLGRELAAGREITGALTTELAHDGDPDAQVLIAELGERLGVGLSSLVNIFNPEVIVIGGGVIAAGDLLLEPARATLAARALVGPREMVRVVPARFGAESGMLGAAAIALEGIGG
jgi:glucokinase